jgi:hypothetical protein
LRSPRSLGLTLALAGELVDDVLHVEAAPDPDVQRLHVEREVHELHVLEEDPPHPLPHGHAALVHVLPAAVVELGLLHILQAHQVHDVEGRHEVLVHDDL